MIKKVAFSGVSNSGKTTLIEKIIKILVKENKKILVIKHDPKDKATFDTKGKDSHRFFTSGAEVIVSSPKRTTHFSHKENQIEEILQNIDPSLDYVFIEGFKKFNITRITVARGKIDTFFLDVTDAFAIDNTIAKEDIPNTNILDLNDTISIIKWINKNT